MVRDQGSAKSRFFFASGASNQPRLQQAKALFEIVGSFVAEAMHSTDQVGFLAPACNLQRHASGYYKKHKDGETASAAGHAKH